VGRQQKIVGSINFSQIGLHNFVEFGLYTNSFEQLKGAGRILEAVAISYAFRELSVSKLKLEVFSNNEREINFYKKCGFKLTDMKKVNNKDILHMEKRKIVESRQ
jgi:RimJ/RimL family protein N-acetyltransferase